MFYIVEVDNDAFGIRDSYGNTVGIVSDADGYRLLTGSKIDGYSTGPLPVMMVSPNRVGISIDGYSIQPLPVRQGPKAAGSGAWPETLYDAYGHAIGVVLDGTAYRLQTQTKIVRASDGAQVNPATEETLGLIKTTDGIKKIVDALPTGDNRIGRIKITDDTNVLGVDTANAAYVAGKSAPGVAPSSNPVSVSGVDKGGLKRTVLTDTQGRLVVTSAGSSAVLAGFAFGQVVLAATTPVPVRSQAYTEQSSNAQRSLVSSSANDTAAGTGARTVKITYYTSALVGPKTETVTLNGTTPVNTANSDICYIEKMEVVTAGASATVPVGTVSLKAATAGGGATIWTIAAGEGQTFGAHHYVQAGVTCYITGFDGGIKGADTTGFYLKASDLTTPGSPGFERQITETLRAPSSGSTPIRTFGTAIQVPGPARVTLYAAPDSTSSRTYYGSFDYYEQ